MSSSADVCEMAADILETNGRCRGLWHNEQTGEHCLHGALVAATTRLGLMFVPRDVWATLRRLVLDRLPDTAPATTLRSIAPGLVCEWWSDHMPAERDADVVDVLRLAAKELATVEAVA